MILKSPRIRAAIVGCGAVGLYYGIKLAQAGAEVCFLMRTGLPEALANGLRIEHPSGRTETLHSALCTNDPAVIGPVDWVIIALKATANHQLPRLIPPLLGPATRLLTLQNGLGHEESLAATFPGHPVYGGLCFVCLNRTTPACVRHLGHGALALGALTTTLPPSEQPPPGPALEALAALWRAAGIQAETVPSLSAARWRKLIWNVPFNGLTVLVGGAGVDAILARPALLARCRALMEEIRAAAAAEGIIIPAVFLDDQIAKTRGMGPYQPSSALDFLAGRDLELDAIWCAPRQAARAAGVPTPELDALILELRQALARRSHPPRPNTQPL